MSAVPIAKPTPLIAVVSDADLEHAEKVLTGYNVMGLAEARKRDLTGASVILWPSLSVAEIGWFRSFALEICDHCTAKLVNVMAPGMAIMTLATIAAADPPMTLAAIADYLNGKLDGVVRIDVIAHEVQNVVTNTGSQIDGGEPSPTDAFQKSALAPEREPDSPGQSSEAQAAGPPPVSLAHGDMPDASLPFGDVSDDGSRLLDYDPTLLDADIPATSQEYRPNTFARPPEPLQPEEWPDPVNLWGGATTPDFPPSCLPPEIEPYIRDQASRAGVDIAQVAANCYTVCAAMIRAGIGVQMQEDMGDGSRVWTEFPILWCAIIGMHGEKKGVGLEIATHFLRAIDYKARKDEEEAWKRHDLKVKVHEKRMQQYYAEAAKNPSAPIPELDEPPPRTRYWTDDATLGGLAKTFQENPRKKITIIKDELSGWFGSFDAFTNGKSDIDRPAYLSAYESKPRPIDRVGGGTWFIDPFGVPIIGGIQPDVLQKIAHKLGADGMLQRFQIIISKPAVQVPRRPANAEASAQWKKIQENLAAMMPRGNPVRLSKQAAEFMDAKVKWIAQAVQSGISPGLAGAVNKWEGLFGRLAITSHCIADSARGLPEPSPEISLAIMEQCWTWMREFLWPHAVQFYEAQHANSPENAMLIKFADYVLARDIKEVRPGYLSGKWSTYRELKTIQQRREFWDSVINIGLGRSANEGFDKTGQIPRRIIINEKYLDGRFAERAEFARDKAEKHAEIMSPAFIAAQRREPGEDG